MYHEGRCVLVCDEGVCMCVISVCVCMCVNAMTLLVVCFLSLLHFFYAWPS